MQRNCSKIRGTSETWVCDEEPLHNVGHPKLAEDDERSEENVLSIVRRSIEDSVSSV